MFIILIAILTLGCVKDFNQYLIKTGISSGNIQKSISMDINFTDEEKKIIIKAATNWELASKNYIKINVFESKKINISNNNKKIPIIKVSKNDKIVKDLEENKDKTILGFYIRDLFYEYLLVVSDRLDNENKFEALILHELGHLIGLDHIDLNLGVAIMNPEIVNGVNDKVYHLTELDINELCNKYKHICL